ncbi:MAG: type II secretion system protein [bacterium]
MDFNYKNISSNGTPENNQVGYTLLEILSVTAIIVILVLATQGMTKTYKRFAVEENCVQRLKEIARHEHTYRYSGDPTVNPNGFYASFFDLQNAGLVPDLYDQSDEKRHTVNAFVPFYQLNFMRSQEEHNLDPDAFRYFIEAAPLPNSMGLKTFYMQEDGEVYWKQHDFWLKPR